MRLSRGCYDKYHRCPGWNGGGPHYAKRHRCDDGRIQVNYDDPLWKIKFQRCNRCDVIVWPYLTRRLSPFEAVSDIRHWWREVQYRRRHR